MNVNLKPGKYVVAVSGGVDSVVLLDLLRRQPGLELVVAHFDHGMRPDSARDRQFVQGLAGQLGLPYVYNEGRLGQGASEAAARAARYKFLRQVKAEVGADAIITAHHQDDVLETAIINLIRGTGRLGLSSLGETAAIKRPLLSVPKSDILAYAKSHRLKWCEDSTNREERYLRNYVRQQVVTKLGDAERLRLLNLLAEMARINSEVNSLVTKLLTEHGQGSQLERGWFIGLPHDASREVLAGWLRAQGLADFDRRGLERLSVGAKTRWPGQRLDVLGGRQLKVGRRTLALERPER